MVAHDRFHGLFVHLFFPIKFIAKLPCDDLKKVDRFSPICEMRKTKFAVPHLMAVDLIKEKLCVDFNDSIEISSQPSTQPLKPFPCSQKELPIA